MSKINAKLVAVFADDAKVVFDVEWDGQCIMGDAAERLMFSDEFEAHGSCPPELDVFLIADETIKSRVGFDQAADELYSTRDLAVLLAKQR